MFPHFLKPLLNNAKNTLPGIPAFVIRLAGGLTQQQSNGLFHPAYRVNRKLAIARSLHHFTVEHQVLHVGFRNDHTLGAGQTTLELAGGKEAFNFLVHTANGLHLAKLVH